MRERTVGNRLSSSEISSYYYMYFLFIYYILYYEQIYTHFDTQKHWRQKVIMQEHILPWTSSNDRVCGQFKTPLHLSAPQQPCARQPWAILITRGSSGPYSMGLHTASSTLHKTVCSQPFFCQYGVGSSLEVPSRSQPQLGGTHSIMFATLIWFLSGEGALGRLVWIWGLLTNLALRFL